MYAFLARFSSRFKWWVVLCWVALAVTLFLVAPKLSKVGVTDQSQFLPQDTESATASAILKEKFAASSQTAPATGLIVVYDSLGLSDTDMQQAQQLHDWLISGAAPSVITSVVSIFDSDALRSTLISADGTTMLMSMNFSVSALDTSAKEAITQIRTYIHDNFPASHIYFTGDAGLLNDLFGSVQDTINRTTLVTIILVTILLLIVYRSPVAVLLPLITIGCSYLVSMGVLGYMAQAGMKVSTLAEAYLVVIIFGVGTDYCLFIVSRFREELLKSERVQAQQIALRHIGPVIAASAFTVVVAFLALGISRFGMNQTTGYAMALGVALTLVAGLTLTPALMSIFGKYVFWPTRNQVIRPAGRFGWHTVGRWVSSHPAFVAVPIIMLLAVPYLAIHQMKLSAGIANQMPNNAESVAGFNIFTEHFPGGEFSPLYLIVQLPSGEVFSQTNLEPLKDVASALAAGPGVARVDYYNAPVTGLNALILQLNVINGQIAQGILPDSSALAVIQSLGNTLQTLPLQYPGIVQSQNFTQAAGVLQQFQTTLAALPTTTTPSIPQLMGQLQTDISAISGSLTGLVGEFNLASSSSFTAYLLSTYFSTARDVSRLNIVLSGNPYSSAATSTVALLRKSAENSIESSTISSAVSFLGGEAATRADILNINDSDFGRVTVLAVIGVLLVIMLLMRSLLAPLYMVLTVLLNYGATLGIATWLFLDVMKKDSIIYMIPLFVFVILVALGADYNIFLMSRIREEAHKEPMKKAVENAVGGTGGVITACGIILAGTFATLMTSSLGVVFEIGAAIAIGIIIDTFFVRALLIPALATILGRWSWWPSSLFFKLSNKHNGEIKNSQPGP
jgi:RND superfamily putative drug exporter